MIVRDIALNEEVNVVDFEMLVKIEEQTGEPRLNLYGIRETLTASGKVERVRVLVDTSSKPERIFEEYKQLMRKMKEQQ